MYLQITGSSRSMGPRSNAVATTLQRSKGGQFVSHIQALPGTPYDGLTPQTVIPAIKAPGRRNVDPHHRRYRLQAPQRPKSHRFKDDTAGQ
jgi:transposase, IS5 family